MLNILQRTREVSLPCGFIFFQNVRFKCRGFGAYLCPRFRLSSYTSSSNPYNTVATWILKDKEIYWKLHSFNAAVFFSTRLHTIALFKHFYSLASSFTSWSSLVVDSPDSLYQFNHFSLARKNLVNLAYYTTLFSKETLWKAMQYLKFRHLFNKFKIFLSI